MDVSIILDESFKVIMLLLSIPSYGSSPADIHIIVDGIHSFISVYICRSDQFYMKNSQS